MGHSAVIISLFCILRQFYCIAGDRMDARNTWEEDFHVSNDTAWNRGGFNGDLGIEFSFRLEFKKNEMRYMFF